MNPPNVDDFDYIHFLVAAQQVFSTVEAAKVRAKVKAAPAYDAYAHLLQRILSDSPV